MVYFTITAEWKWSHKLQTWGEPFSLELVAPPVAAIKNTKVLNPRSSLSSALGTGAHCSVQKSASWGRLGGIWHRPRPSRLTTLGLNPLLLECFWSSSSCIIPYGLSFNSWWQQILAKNLLIGREFLLPRIRQNGPYGVLPPACFILGWRFFSRHGVLVFLQTWWFQFSRLNNSILH